MGPFSGRRRWRSQDAKSPRERRQQVGPGPGHPMFALVRALVILLFGILSVQLIRMQIIVGDEYSRRAEINALREVQVPSARGLIYDRNMEPLVQNTARFSAAIVPGDLPERGGGGVYRTLARVVGVPGAEIERKVKEGIDRQGPYSPVVVKEDLERDIALALTELEPHVPGLKVLVQPARRYLAGPMLSHELGYVGPLSQEEYDELSGSGYLFQDYIGKSGVEDTYESILRGKPGKKLIEVDAAGRELKVISERRPVDGSNLVLSIDLELQKKVAEVLREATGPDDNGAAVV